MFVRVFDKPENRYYKSIVYGIIDVGYYERAILLNPYTESFELVDYLDKEDSSLTPLYEVINSNTDGWVLHEKTFMLKLKHYLSEQRFNGDIKQFRGYQDVFDDFPFILAMLEHNSIAVNKVAFKLRDNYDTDEWNYIRTQKDADDFMKIFAGFHDSTLDKLVYDEEYGKKRLLATFDNSGWYGTVNLCFEGIITLHLKPYSENYCREIYDSTLLVKDESIYWADNKLEQEDLNYQGTYIKALNLKWRKIK